MKPGKPTGRPENERSPIDGRTQKERRREVADLMLTGYLDLARATDLDPELSEIRDRYTKELTEAYADKLNSSAQKRTAAKKPRPSRQSPLRARIVEIMRRARENDESFDDFFGRWKRRPIDGITLKYLGAGRCKVDNGEVPENDAIERATYMHTTLKKTLWAAAGKKKRSR